MKLNISKVEFNKADIKKSITIPNKITQELAEETGLHIGDGSMNFYKNGLYYGGKYSLRGHIIDDVSHYDYRITHLYRFLYNYKPRLTKMESTGVYGFQIWSNSIVTFKNKILGLPLGNKLYVKIPNEFLSNKEYFSNVVRGIFDTDGCIYLEKKNNKLYSRIQIVTVSTYLAEQLKINLNRIGFRATKYVEKRNHLGWNDNNVISVRGDEMLRKWIDLIGPKNSKHNEKFEYYIENS